MTTVMEKSMILVCVLAILIVTPLPALAADGEYTFTTVEYPGSRDNTIYYITLSGVIIGSCDLTGYVKIGDTITPIPSHDPFDINEAGLIVGARRDGVGMMTNLENPVGNITYFIYPGAPWSPAYGVNSAGQIAGACSIGGYHGYLKQGDTISLIDVPGAENTEATDINDSGKIVGFYWTGDAYGARHGFLKEGATWTMLDFPGAVQTFPQHINNAGHVVGYYSDRVGPSTYAETHGFIRIGETWHSFDFPGQARTHLFGINDAGVITGLYCDSHNWQHGFIATPTRILTETTPGVFWIGLRNSDDQGTQFDLRAELYIKDRLVTQGETRCITGVTRNPSYAKEVSVPFDPVMDGAYQAGDILFLKVYARIGTTPDGLKCIGPGGSHNNAVGLRLYYDTTSRPSRLGLQFAPNPVKDYYLHTSSGTYYLNDVPPTWTGTAIYNDSGSLNYSGGNPWKEIGTWKMTLQ